MREVKDYLDKELNRFVLANVIILLLLAGQLDVLSNAKTILVFGINLTSIIAVASPLYIYVFFFNYIYSPKLKTRLIFWWNDMPGCTIFSDILMGKIKDSRFTQAEAVEKYDAIYIKISEYKNGDEANQIRNYENASWYKIYQRYKNEKAVLDALRGQLLCRDACVATFSMLVMLGLLWFIGYGYYLNCKCGIFLVLVYLFSNLAARLRAKRLVLTVIALDISSGKKKTGAEQSE